MTQGQENDRGEWQGTYQEAYHTQGGMPPKPQTKSKNVLLKFSLILSGVCFAVGLILLCAGAAGGGLSSLTDVQNWRPSVSLGWPFHGISFGTYATMDKVDVFEEVTDGGYIEKIELDVDFGTVTIQQGDQLCVTSENVSEKKYKCSLDNSVLKVEDISGKFTFGKWFGKDINRSIVITIPNGVEIGSVACTMGAGTFQAEDLSCADAVFDLGAGEGIINRLTVRSNLDITVGAGECNVESIILGNGRDGTCNIACGAGEVYAHGDIYGQIDVECGVGQVDLTLQNDAKYYEYDVDCGVGEVSIDGENYKRYLQHRKEHVHPGDLSCYSGQTIDIDCGVGEVNVSFE